MNTIDTIVKSENRARSKKIKGWPEATRREAEAVRPEPRLVADEPTLFFFLNARGAAKVNLFFEA